MATTTKASSKLLIENIMTHGRCTQLSCHVVKGQNLIVLGISMQLQWAFYKYENVETANLAVVEMFDCISLDARAHISGADIKYCQN